MEIMLTNQSEFNQEVFIMASGGEELVKYITEKVVVYIEDPRARHAARKEATKQPWSQKWFGMLPLGWSIWRSNLGHKNKE